ncbi:MAG: hypothetical protein ACK55I_29445, partial [bacterium]
AKPDLQLTSPKLANTDTGLFQLIPALSYDSVEIDPSSASDEVMTQVVTDVNSRFRTIKSKWSTAFSEIEAGYLVVINDIRQLQGLLSSVVTNSDSQKSVWQRLEHVSSQVAATSIDLQAYM